MNRLNDLLKGLHINVAIIVEDAFETVNPKEALSGMLVFNDVSWKLFFDEIEKTNKNFGSELNEFRVWFKQLTNHDQTLLDKLLPNGDLAEYLKQTEQDIEKYNKILLAFDKHYESVKHLFLKYGVCVPPDNYPAIINVLNESYVKVIYNECPVPKEYDEFYNTINEAIEITNSRFCLAIIDKAFSEGNSGEEFIKHINDDEKNKIEFLSFIYTSKPKANMESPNTKDEYFLREISKNNDNVMHLIVKYTAQCAGAILFDNYKTSVQNGAETAFKTTMENEKNITKILTKAGKEGTSPYNALNNWYQLATQFYAEKVFLEDIQYTVALSQFYNSISEETEPAEVSEKKATPANSSSSGSTELSDISRFEVFDFNVNKKHLPIANGDIFKSGNKYYLLVGQPCDLSLRVDNTRNYSLAEVIELEDSTNVPVKKEKNYQKINADYLNNRKIIYLKDFKESDLQNIVLTLSQKKINYLDFRILDLCMLNDDGFCKLPKEISSNKFAILPQNREVYFSRFSEDLSKIHQSIGEESDLKEKLVILENNHLIKITAFEVITDDWSYRFQRIARIKQKFMNLISEEITDYKSRVGLDYFEE